MSSWRRRAGHAEAKIDLDCEARSAQANQPPQVRLLWGYKVKRGPLSYLVLILAVFCKAQLATSIIEMYIPHLEAWKDLGLIPMRRKGPTCSRQNLCP